MTARNKRATAERNARSPETTQRFAAFLRGVSPMNAKMPDLKRSFEDAGFTDVKTLLSSGNVVFSASGAADGALEDDRPDVAPCYVNGSLEREAERAMLSRLGRSFLTIVRPLDTLRAILDSDPYGSFRLSTDAKRVVTFLRKATRSKPRLPIELDGARILCCKGSEVFSAYVPSPRGPAFMTLIEKTFGEEVTTRTWDTVRRVVHAG